MNANGNTLILAPHPDDEVLGCGGIMKLMADNCVNVYVLVVTRGKKDYYPEEKIINVRNEAKNAHDLLGVKETLFLDYPAPDLDRVSLAELALSISRVIKDLNIKTLFLPHLGDCHHDHKIVFNAGLVASRPVAGCTVREIFSYETLSETEWAAPIGSEVFIPTRFVDVNTVFQFKLQAIQCYKSQLRDFPNPRSLKAIEALAVFRGSMSGLMLAEAFMTIRIIDI